MNCATPRLVATLNRCSEPFSYGYIWFMQCMFHWFFAFSLLSLTFSSSLYTFLPLTVKRDHRFHNEYCLSLNISIAYICIAVPLSNSFLVTCNSSYCGPFKISYIPLLYSFMDNIINNALRTQITQFDTSFFTSNSPFM